MKTNIYTHWCSLDWKYGLLKVSFLWVSVSNPILEPTNYLLPLCRPFLLCIGPSQTLFMVPCQSNSKNIVGSLSFQTHLSLCWCVDFYCQCVCRCGCARIFRPEQCVGVMHGGYIWKHYNERGIWDQHDVGFVVCVCVCVCVCVYIYIYIMYCIYYVLYILVWPPISHWKKVIKICDVGTWIISMYAPLVRSCILVSKGITLLPLFTGYFYHAFICVLLYVLAIILLI